MSEKMRILAVMTEILNLDSWILVHMYGLTKWVRSQKSSMITVQKKPIKIFKLGHQITKKAKNSI